MPNPLGLSMQPNVALTTQILLGTATETEFPGQILIPRVDMEQFGQQRFQYAHVDPSQIRFEELELRRGWAQPFQEVDIGLTFETVEHVRYGVKKSWDWEEPFAAAIQLGALAFMDKKLQDPRQRLERSIEGQRLDFATDPSSFDNVITIPGGESWDEANGDPRSVIDQALDFVSVTGAKPEDCALMLSWPAMLALRNSPDWREFRVASGNERRPTVDDVATFLGIGRAWQTFYKRWDTTANDLLHAFSDSCILYVENKNPTNLDVSMGSRLTWAVDVAQRAPFASIRWSEPDRTADSAAWTDYSQPTVLSPMAAVLINNCSSTYP